MVDKTSRAVVLKPDKTSSSSVFLFFCVSTCFIGSKTTRLRLMVLYPDKTLLLVFKHYIKRILNNQEKTNPICSTVESQASFQVKYKFYTLATPLSRKCSRLQTKRKYTSTYRNKYHLCVSGYESLIQMNITTFALPPR